MTAQDTGLCLWLTGLPGSGKTTLAFALREQLRKDGNVPIVLDGDALRAGLNRDLGFDRASRRENVRRIAEVACLLAGSGHTVLVASISPFAEDRLAARQLFAAGRFIEVFVDAPPETCRARDPKGLYALADRGGLQGLTGWDAEYEMPLASELVVSTDTLPVAACVAMLLACTRVPDTARLQSTAA